MTTSLSLRHLVVVIVGVVLIGSAFLWTRGTFDYLVWSLHLNYKDCARNGFGGVFCGRDLEEYKAKVAGVTDALAGLQSAVPLSQATVDETAADDSAAAAANVRSIIPSIESYFADNNTYSGMTLEGLKTTYDQALDTSFYALPSRSLSANSYCVSSTAGASMSHKAGPSAQITVGLCP